MNKSKKQEYNSKDANSIKFKMMELSGIDMDYMEFYDIYVNELETVHVLIIDDYTIEDKIDTVFIHGLTGTSLYYYKCFKALSKYMRIIALDLPGMGLSNRVPIKDIEKYDFAKTENFFVTRVDIALNKLGIDKFHFITHSFGGYVSCLYTIYHPERVISLQLLSPVGITSIYHEWISTPMEDFFQKVFYAIRKPPSEGYKMIPFAEKILEKMLAHKLKYISCEEERNVFKDMISCVYNQKSTSEYLIYHFFNGSIQAYKPVIYYYELLDKVKIDFIYGDRDWNPLDHAEELQKVLPNVGIHIVIDSGHILYCDNHTDLSIMIIKILNKNGYIELSDGEKKSLDLKHKNHLNEIKEENPSVMIIEDRLG